MNGTNFIPVTISIDNKKHRIVVHKNMLHLLGDPPYIQLLIDPDSMMFAIKALDRTTSGDQTHKINKKALKSDNSVEIYSMTFISKLNSVAGILYDESLYHMPGVVISPERIAVFSMKNLTKAQSEQLS